MKDRHWLAHTISDDVLRTLWGTEGIARTHLLCVQQVGRAREIYWMDYDGAAASGGVNARQPAAQLAGSCSY